MIVINRERGFSAKMDMLPSHNESAQNTNTSLWPRLEPNNFTGSATRSSDLTKYFMIEREITTSTMMKIDAVLTGSTGSVENKSFQILEDIGTLGTNNSLFINDSYPNLEDLTKIFCSGPMCLSENDTLPMDTNSTKRFENQHINWPILILGILVLLGILGNILVIMAISTEKKLQTVTNYFLLSLAVADLLVSVIVMPFGMTQLLIGYWPFGIAICDLWCFSDVLMCTSSIMHMCTISLDRYLGIANPLKNRNKSRNIVTIKILVVWILSLAISSPVLILGFINQKNVFDIKANQCVLDNKVFQLFGSTCAFIIPLVIMFVSYTLTIKLLHKQAKLCSGKGYDGHPRMRRSISRWRDNSYHRRLSRVNSNSSILSTNSGISRCSNSLPLPMMNRNETSRKLRPESMSSLDDCDACELQSLMRGNSLGVIPENGHSINNGSTSPKMRQMIQKHKYAVRAAGIFINSAAKREERQEKKIQSVKTEQKASKVLGGVFVSFVICWLPFFLTNILISACDSPSCYVDLELMTFFVWLGWASSILNPIIYTIANKTFKRKFISILTCNYPSNNNHKRSRYLKITFKIKSRSPEPEKNKLKTQPSNNNRDHYIQELVTVC